MHHAPGVARPKQRPVHAADAPWLSRVGSLDLASAMGMRIALSRTNCRGTLRLSFMVASALDAGSEGHVLEVMVINGRTCCLR